MTNTPDDAKSRQGKTVKRIGKRQPILDAKKQAEICAILAMGIARSRAAEYVGCSANSILRTAEKCPEFAEALRKAEAQHEIALLARIDSVTKRPDGWRAAGWILQRLYPERYARRPKFLSPVQVGIVLSQFADILTRGIRDLDDRRKVGNELRLLASSFANEAAGEQSS